MKRRAIACHCGWRYLGFHICVDLAGPEPKHKKIKKYYAPKPSNGSKRGSEEWRYAISEGSKNFRERQLELKKPRDRTIVAKYDAGMTMVEVAKDMELSHITVRAALHRARDAGDVIIRPAGGGRRTPQL